MMYTKLQETIFEIEKIKSVVNVGQSSAYQIYTSPGQSLGRIGTVVETSMQAAANEQAEPVIATNEPRQAARRSVFRNLLSRLA